MSIINKYLRNATNSLNSTGSNSRLGANKQQQHNNSSSSAASSSRSSSASSYSWSPSPRSTTAMASTSSNNKMLDKIEFKPFKSSVAAAEQKIQHQQARKSKFGGIGTGDDQHSLSANTINNLLHSTTHKNGSGKISKRKVDKTSTIGAKKLTNFGLVQCFNLAEKEKFRQLITQNLLQNSSKAESKNAYQKLIRSSPTRTRDDNILRDDFCRLQATTTPKIDQTDRYSLANVQNKVSAFYTRRICLTPLPPNKTSTAAATRKVELLACILKEGQGAGTTASAPRHGATSSSRSSRYSQHNESIVELLDDTNELADEEGENKSLLVGVKKAAQKRAPIPEINLADSDDEDNLSIVKQQESDLMSRMSTINKANRPLTEFEKKLNEKMSQNTVILEAIFKSKTSSKTLTIEEDRYKFKKRQRLEKEKIEKELSSKLWNQLNLETTGLSRLYFREEEKVEEIIEDDFPELNDEQESLIEAALVAYPQEQVLVSGFGADITRKDIQTLRGLNWLNDEIINFYMNLVCERSRVGIQQSSNAFILRSCYAFSTFFYPKLVKEGYSQSLKRWTRKVDLFAHELVLIPVHLGLHWTLAVIDFSCQEIRYYDSMNGFNNECLKLLKNYLSSEYAEKKGGAQLDLSKWSCIHVRDVPQQMNGSDCGMFACKYAEYLSRGRIQFNFNQSHMPYFRRRMIWEILNKKLL